VKAALVQATFAPFHFARLERAIVERRSSYDALGVEIASTQSDYYWSRPRSEGTIRTLFADRDYWSVSPRAIAKSLSAELDRWGTDVVVLPGWGFKESIAGLSWAMLRGRAAVLLSDSAPVGGNQIRTLARRWVISNFDAAFVGGSKHRRFILDMGMQSDRVFTGCDVVDNEFFGAAERRARGPQHRPVLCSVTRMIPVKNIPAVLQVLASEAPEWEWIIAGDGPERTEIERRIQVLGLSGRVHLLGHIRYEDLPAVYARADVYLQPSLSDTWGLAVNEAMASGLPVVVSTGAGCSADLVRDEVNGFVFDPGRPGDLAASLRRAIRSRNRWPSMGAASSEIIADWGLARFANGFWQACEVAVEHRRAGRRSPRSQLGHVLPWLAELKWLRA